MPNTGVSQNNKILVCGNCGYERVYKTKNGKLDPEWSTFNEIEMCKVVEEGEATSYTPLTLTKSDASWDENQWEGKLIRIVAHDGGVQETIIFSNTEDTLVLRKVLRGNGWPNRSKEDPLFAENELPSFKIIDPSSNPTRGDIAEKLWDNNSFICVCGTKQDSIDQE
jgi:hypothetical protein